MKISDTVRATSLVAVLLIASRFCSAQDKPIGDVAREARAQKSEHHAKKVVTNDDLSPDKGPLQGPVRESDDPLTVVREAWRDFLADAGHTCQGKLTGLESFRKSRGGGPQFFCRGRSGWRALNFCSTL